ncbi:MAG: PRC-barrel domain-containing protein [Candidatus Eiseniibacteriota bacterium]
MRRINLLAASALVLALAAPAYSQTAAPGTTDKPTQLERSAPADNPAVEKSAPGASSSEMNKSSSDMGKGASDHDKSAMDKDSAAKKATTQAGGVLTQQATSQKLADTYIGMKVENPNKDKVGEISDLIFDDQDHIVGAVLSVGGFLGIGDKHVGLSWNELKFEGSGKEEVAVVTLTKDQLKSAPSFKTQADLQSQQEAERRKLERPATPSGGTLGGGSTGTNR